MGEHADLPPPTILVVDDNEANRALARSTLEDEGYRVVSANDGAEGIRVFEKEHPDCVLLDVRMPEIDGFAACERIRALPRGPETPIIFLTALRDVDTFDRALRAGGDDFLTKPVRPTELVVRVQTALKLRRMSVELREHFDLLRQQRDDLMRLQLQKERLTAFVVHDLKNPVNGIAMMVQLALRKGRDLPESQRSYFLQIERTCREMMRLIQNLLEITKIEEGKMPVACEPIVLAEVVDEVVHEYAPVAEQAGRRLTVAVGTDLPPAAGDRALLKRVIVNLVVNALRHSGSREVRVEGRSDTGRVLLGVVDFGHGIAEDNQARIFEKFRTVRRSPADDPATDTGLGLPFCKLAVERMGGRVTVASIPGVSTVFTVELPAFET